MVSARCLFKTHFTNLNNVADLSDADRSGLSNLQISDEDLQKVNAEVEKRLREFFATVDPVIQKFTTEDLLLKSWKAQHIIGIVGECLRLPVTPSSAASRTAVDSFLSPEKTTLRPDTTASGIYEALPKRNRQDEEEGYTSLNEIATTAQLRYNVKGKVLMIGKLGHIPFNNEGSPTFAYVLGSPQGTMEVAVLGKTTFGVANAITPLLNNVVSRQRAGWDNKRGTLKHLPGTVIQSITTVSEEFDATDFKWLAFEIITSLQSWARASVRGVVHSSDEPEESDRYPGKSYTDFLLRDVRKQGIRLRVVESSNHMPMIEKNQVAVLRDAKVCCKVLYIAITLQLIFNSSTFSCF